MKMKALLILLTVLSVVFCAVDYCDVEKRLCGSEKHIGCDKNVFMDDFYPNNPVRLGAMTNELKKQILDQLNSFRSLIATGQKTQFESASNMRLVTWNNEMEHISKRLLIKFWGNACIKIDNFPLSTVYSTNIDTNEDPSVFLKRVIDDLLKDIFMQRTADQLDYSRFYGANLNNIGCSFGIYQHFAMSFLCITSIDDSSSFTEAYLPGNPCSNCSMFNQVCSKKYKGLCEDSLNQ